MKKRIEELAREIGGFNGNSIVYVAIVNMTLAVNEAPIGNVLRDAGSDLVDLQLTQRPQMIDGYQATLDTERPFQVQCVAI